jgi:hypothetical protein
MKPSRIQEVLDQLLSNTWPVFIWGSPGVGKSSVVRRVAEQNGLPLLDIRASLLDPTDLRGIPSIQDGRAVWCPPEFLPREEQPPGILFFDELNAAPPLVQASLYQLTLDRRVGEYDLPEGWRIIAAGNRSEDVSIVFRMPAALSNRFIHVDFEIDFEDWRDWAVDTGIHPMVVGFLGVRRELLFDMRNTDRGFPTPRSWEIVSDTLKAMGGYQASRDLLLGIVGEGAALEFLGYCEAAITEEALMGILNDPASARLPTDLGDLYALVSYAASRARDEKVMEAAGVLLGRLEPELAVLLMRDVLRSNARFLMDTGYLAFVQEHHESIV